MFITFGSFVLIWTITVKSNVKLSISIQTIIDIIALSNITWGMIPVPKQTLEVHQLRGRAWIWFIDFDTLGTVAKIRYINCIVVEALRWTNYDLPCQKLLIDPTKTKIRSSICSKLTGYHYELQVMRCQCPEKLCMRIAKSHEDRCWIKFYYIFSALLF